MNGDLNKLILDPITVENDVKSSGLLLNPGSRGMVSIYFSNILRGAMIKLQHFKLLLMGHTEKHSPHIPNNLHEYRQNSIATLRAISKDILNSVSLVIPISNTSATSGCWADAMRLLWPLMVVSWVKHGLQEHQDKARLALQKIGCQMGIRAALNLR